MKPYGGKYGKHKWDFKHPTGRSRLMNRNADRVIKKRSRQKRWKKMKDLILLCLLIMSFNTNAQLIEEDKQAHMIGAGLAAVPTYYFSTDFIVETPLEGILLTTVIAGVAGWGFEHYQKATGRGTYDNGDILAAMTGALTGAVFARLIEYDPERRARRSLRKQQRRQRKHLKQISKHE